MNTWLYDCLKAAPGLFKGRAAQDATKLRQDQRPPLGCHQEESKLGKR